MSHDNHDNHDNDKSRRCPGADHLLHRVDGRWSEDRGTDGSCDEEGFYSDEDDDGEDDEDRSIPAMSSFKELKPSHGYFQVSLELGGKNAAVVFDDADVEAAVAGVTRFFIGTFFLGIVKSSW